VTSESTPAQRAITRRLAASVWRFRYSAELDAAARFERLAGELEAVDAVPPVVAMAREAAADELKHARMCAGLVQWLGGTPPTARLSHSARPPSPAGLGARDGVLYEVVAMSCLTETLSAALIGEMVLQAKDAHVRKVMRDILRDEVSHARLGWAHLAAEVRRGSTDFLGAFLPAMMAGTVDEELFSVGEEHAAAPEVAGLGALTRADRRRIFEETMERVTFPGLERFGVDTRSAREWLGNPAWRRAG
jgi:hypothetical protein